MPQHTEDQVNKRRVNVANLYLKGWTQLAIAAEEGVTQAQISLDLKEIRAGWKESTLIDFNEAKARELAKIDNLEATYWDAWDRSKQPLKKKLTKMRGEINAVSGQQKQKAKNLETTEAFEERTGDPRYLDGVYRCIQKRVEILGLDAPQSLLLGGTNGGPLMIDDVSRLTTDELLKRITDLRSRAADLRSRAADQAAG